MRWLIGVVVCICAYGAQAHQMKTAIATVLFNERTGNIEVMQRYYVHDAEHVLSSLLGRQVNLIDDQAAQQQFSRYAAAHFSMGLDGPNALGLQFVGQEVEGKFIWVYQELPLPSNPVALWFSFDALQDHWPEQINQVNVEGLGPVRSLSFSAGDGWQSLFL
ncbi:hypothetical protein R50072_23650 [Simiduia litorea]|uniref:DUF6702 family protein n=1 Tax=Simiduia litorea TaxID=1435348 RepID=UPI0036F40A0A